MDSGSRGSTTKPASPRDRVQATSRHRTGAQPNDYPQRATVFDRDRVTGDPPSRFIVILSRGEGSAPVTKSISRWRRSFAAAQDDKSCGYFTIYPSPPTAPHGLPRT